MESKFPYAASSGSAYFDELFNYLNSVSQRMPLEEQSEISEAMLNLAKIRANRWRTNLPPEGVTISPDAYRSSLIHPAASL